MRIEVLAEGVKEGKSLHLAKAITLIESNREADQEKAHQLLNLVQEQRDTIRVGISGVPGVGKSTFIEALGNMLINQGHKVAVLAVDPSSPASGGSILGDKTRMETLATRKEAFIRPSPTSGILGGVAKKTRESIHLCEAAGYDVILVETVGVGQSEFEVASMVDCFLVLMLPGAGDSLQGIKRGILEITDIMVINKADGDQQKKAEYAKAEYKQAFQLLSQKYEGINVEFFTASALYNEGITGIWKGVEDFIFKLKEKELFEELRTSQALNWFKQLTEEQVLARLWADTENAELLSQLEEKIKKKGVNPSAAAMRLADELVKKSLS